MTGEILIEVGPIETRIAVIEDARLAELLVEESDQPSLVGSIWLGRVSHVASGIQAAFVDLGLPRAGFLNRADAEALAGSGEGRPIEKLLHEGQWILVQVRKDADREKGVGLTTAIALPGRALVFTPHRREVTLSRRIADPAERRRLGAALADLPSGGAILRTVAAETPTEEVRAEAERLARLHEELRAAKGDRPRCLWREPEPALRILRDRLDGSVAEVLIDDEATYARALDFARGALPALAGRIRRHAGPGPVLARHGVLDEIALLEGSRVPLPSGGAITIETTRALTAIDVDSGRDTGGQDQERIALRTNLEAAVEAARQMRLRDLGGIIVIDFIQLRESASKERLMERLAGEIRHDRAPVRMSALSEFGLVELTRRRATVALGTRHLETCGICGGSGRRPSLKAEMAAALRAVQAEGAAMPGRAFTLRLPPRVAEALSAHPALDWARRRLGAALVVVADDSLAPGQHQISIGGAERA